jgi:cold shock CspA family protein
MTPTPPARPPAPCSNPTPRWALDGKVIADALNDPFPETSKVQYPNEDHGFILTHEGTRLYFHRDSLMAGAFHRLKVGDPVHFTQIDGDTGPLAYKIWPAAVEVW